jgi:capsular polysaccharide biosynthesis protein
VQVTVVVSGNQRAFRRWWWLVPIAAGIGLAGAFLSLRLAETEYQATCSLFVSVPPNTSPGESYQAAQFGQARVAAYLELIKGGRVAESAVNSLNLDMSPQDLAQRIDARADPESVVMNVSVTDGQAQRSADLANAVCTQFLAVAADAEGPSSPINVRMIENAAAPSNPIAPSPKRYLGVGVVAGILGGIALVVLLGRMMPGDTRQEDPRDGRVSAPSARTKAEPSDVVAPAAVARDGSPSGDAPSRRRR